MTKDMDAMVHRIKEKMTIHYTPECPICKGVMLPEKVERLEKALEALRRDRDYWYDRAKGRWP